MKLYSLLYISRSLVTAESGEMQAIAEASQRNNGARGITGFLYYDNAFFLQVLEGLREDVLELYAVIEKDPRHNSVRVLHAHSVESRAFGGWAMGLYDGELDGGLLGERFGPEVLTAASDVDAVELVRFLRDLSLGRSDVYELQSSG
ncbi:MAG: BLUF domain-containing protein [Pseudomonadota bacterium]